MNLLLICIDTLRADHLGCYGFGRPISPHIDRIAAEGVVFEQCISPSIPTHPGHTNMLTGRDVFSHQIVCQGSAKVELAEDIPMLAELLREQGYFTAAADNLGRWFGRGYDLYETYRWERDPSKPWRKAEAVNETAFRVLDEALARPQPFFVFLHYWDPHTPYLAPPPFNRMFYSRSRNEKDPNIHVLDEMWASYDAFRFYFAQWLGGLGAVTDPQYVNALYAGEVAYCDACLAEVFTRLQEADKLDETLLVLTSDHGEELDEHQMWWDHHGLYETNLRVPLIMRCPGRLPASRRVKGTVTLTDIVPTVLELLELGELLERYPFDGRSLTPLIAGRRRGDLYPQLYLTECTWMKKRGLRTRQYKLIQRLTATDMHDRPEFELYDLLADPGEQHNLADERPKLRDKLLGRLEAIRTRRMRQTGKPDPHAYQDITLTRVGDINVAVPDNQKLG